MAVTDLTPDLSTDGRRPPLPQAARAWLDDAFLLRAGGSDRVLAMEGLRGFSIILVFFVHFGGMIIPWMPATGATTQLNLALHTVGHQGVDLFFVLSGYLMYAAVIAKPRPYADFLRRRVRRLYPTFAAVFVLYVVLSALFPAESKIPAVPAAAALYLATNALLLPGIVPTEPMITVAWSLSYEVAFYVVLPLLVGGLALRRRGAAARVAIIAAVSLAIAVFLPSYARAAMFGTGMLLAEWARASGRWGTSRRRLDIVGALALAVVIPAGGLLFNPGGLGRLDLYSISLAPVLYVVVLSAGFLPACAAAFSGRGMVARFFSASPLRLLGNMSYSYYLLHGVTLKGFFLLLSLLVPAPFPAAWPFWVLLPAAFVLTCLTSAVLFLAIERRYSIHSPRPALTY